MINIGKLIFESTKEFVNNRCYPLVAENGTTFPFIVYQRDSVIPNDTKDAYIYEWSHNVTIKVVTDRYDEGFEIADKIVNKLYYHQEELGIAGIDVTIQSIGEYYQEDAYIQDITVEFKTN